MKIKTVRSFDDNGKPIYTVEANVEKEEDVRVYALSIHSLFERDFNPVFIATLGDEEDEGK